MFKQGGSVGSNGKTSHFLLLLQKINKVTVMLMKEDRIYLRCDKLRLRIIYSTKNVEEDAEDVTTPCPLSLTGSVKAALDRQHGVDQTWSIVQCSLGILKVLI